MAWSKAHIEIKPASIGTGVKVSLKRFRGASAKMGITITGKTVKEIGWSNGDKIEVLIGEGEHHGLLRLRKNNSVGEAEVTERKAVRGGSYLNIALGHQPAFVDLPKPASWCQWEKIEGGWIEIALPAWADETAPNRKPKTQAAPHARTQPPRGVDVTASLMGDPEPGRPKA